VPLSIHKQCIKAASELDREIAGVDIIQNEHTGMWYCLEVNDSPQLASGVFTAAKQAAFVKFVDKRIRKSGK
jgi:D-alanine-D-alanine ligase-like ATP-grasp enzyme